MFHTTEVVPPIKNRDSEGCRRRERRKRVLGETRGGVRRSVAQRMIDRLIDDTVTWRVRSGEGWNERQDVRLLLLKTGLPSAKTI